MLQQTDTTSNRPTLYNTHSDRQRGYKSEAWTIGETGDPIGGGVGR